MKYISILLVNIVLVSCINRKSEGNAVDSHLIPATVVALVETQSVPQSKNSDSADDPAIWINRKDSLKSVVIGTDKKGGLALYNLQGEEMAYYACGKMNNVDVRYDFPFNGGYIDIVAATNRSTKGVSVFKIDANGLVEIGTPEFLSHMTGEVYGFCLYKNISDSSYYAIVNSKEGEVEIWKLLLVNSKITGELVESFSLRTQTEGMVADDRTGKLYIGMEGAGIVVTSALPSQNRDLDTIKMSVKVHNPLIEYDIEGLAIYEKPNNDGILVASIQGNYSYALFNLKAPYDYLGSFRIVDGTVDGVEETDGLEVINHYPGIKGSSGMLIVQDGFNRDAGKLVAQNFKYVDWTEVEVALGLK